MSTPPALLLVGHGTRDEVEAEAFRSFVGALGGCRPDVPVAGGFVESSRPSPADAVARLAAEGPARLAVVPLMLVAAGHTEGAVRAALARETERRPQVSYAWGRPLGPDPSLLRVWERRLDEALGGAGRAPSDRVGTTVLLVGRGSTDPDANAEVHKAARLLWEGRGYAGVETAFVSLAAPDVASGLDRCRKLGAQRIVVLPYFLFTGLLLDRVRRQAAGWSAVHPEVEVVHADVIGPAPELAELVWARYAEALGGDGPATGGETPSGPGDNGQLQRRYCTTRPRSTT